MPPQLCEPFQIGAVGIELRQFGSHCLDLGGQRRLPACQPLRKGLQGCFSFGTRLRNLLGVLGTDGLRYSGTEAGQIDESGLNRVKFS